MSTETLRSRPLKLGNILVHQGWIQAAELQEALETQKEEKERRLIGNILIEKGVISRRLIYHGLAIQYGKQFVDLSQMKVQMSALQLVSKDFARKHDLMPILFERGVIYVAVPNPSDRKSCDELKKIPSVQEVEIALATPEDIEEAISRYYGGVANKLRLRIRKTLQPMLRYFMIGSSTNF